MTTVILAEKRSQAQDIAKVIGVKAQRDGYIELVDGSYITHASGHLLEQVEPDAYDPAWGGRWAWPQLPMIPAEWKLKLVDRTRGQFRVIQDLLKSATNVVIATDAGREGELIAREILLYCRYAGPVQRFWTSSLVDADIRKALANLKPGAETFPLYEAALARSHSDWLLGLTGTRAATLAANVRGDYFPMGRVKTPTLALVCRRDLEISKFGAKVYYELEAQVRTKKGEEFTMVHSRSEDTRITDKAVAQELLKKAAKASGPLRVAVTREKDNAPLPYSLPTLQQDANHFFGFSASQTLKLAQVLYEKKVCSYPRTDCSYLAESQVAEIEQTLTSIAATLPPLVTRLRTIGTVARPGTFNDAKLSDHHGIIPTSLAARGLDGDELKLYTLVAHRYLQAVAPDCEYNATRVTMDANGVPFKATGKAVTKAGWTQFKFSDKK